MYKRMSYVLLLLVVSLGMVLGNSASVSAASQYTGGLLDGVTVQVGKSIGSGRGVTEITDNNPATSAGNFYAYELVWHTFASPVDISAVVVNSKGKTAIELYDANNNLLNSYNMLSNNGIQTLPAPVSNVSMVVLKSLESVVAVYEWNVFTTPSVAPLPTTINWIQSGDQVIKLEWVETGAKSYNVKRSTSKGGPYALIGNVTGNSYSDTNATNGTTYYYVISAVNEAGESNNSPENSITPNPTMYTGGLLDWLTLQVGKSMPNSTSTTRNITDNNPATSGGNFYGYELVWHTFTSPVDISAVVVNGKGKTAVEFYDTNNNLLNSYNMLSNNGIQTLPVPVTNVSTVVLKSLEGIVNVSEWNVFPTPLTAPLPTTIDWIKSGDQVVKLEWVETGAKSYNVKRSTSKGGPYTVVGNVTGTSYSDTNVTNGNTYYYVVSAVNEAGESSNSPEKSTTPNATLYTGGLLDWVTLQIGKSVPNSTSTTRYVSDNDTSTSTPTFYNREIIWYTFNSPVEITSVIVNSVGTTALELYDKDNSLLGTYDVLVSNQVQTLPAPVDNVVTVVLKSNGSSVKVYEWNVFGKGGELSPEAPLNLIATAGNKSIVLNWSSSNNVVTGFNVKRTNVSGGPYTVIGSVSGDTYSYTDSNVTNGNTYYYIVTAVNATGESSNSNEAFATLQGDVVNPPESGNGERALLRLILINNVEKEYDLSMEEVVAFINWYEGRSNGSGSVMYAINKHDNNKGPFVNRIDYVFYDKIITFEVNVYNMGAKTPETPAYDPSAY